MTLAIPILLIYLAALLGPLLRGLNDRLAPPILAIAPALIFAYFVSLIPEVARGGVIVQTVPFVPSYHFNVSFLLDGLSLSFALLVSGIGVLVVFYAGAYLRDDKHQGPFYLYLLSFMASMLGVVTSDNLIGLFVFWELTSITSYLLIGYNHEDPKARASALQALLVTGGGGLALLAGFVLLGNAAGTYEISEILSPEVDLASHPLYMPILVLILLGCFTKSAQFPFHFWLPNAMSAPTPVSAYLHSSTMVKAGVFLLFRLHPALGGTNAWFDIVVTVGVLTMFVSGFLALRQQVLKPLLAYTTIAALGILTTAAGIGTPLAMKGAITFLFVHAFYKAALFMVAGALDHETGERDVEKLGGLWKAMPLTATAAGVAALSMAGIPPLLGFIGKEVLYDAKWQAGAFAGGVAVVTVFANVANVFVAIKVGFKPFWGERIETPKHPHDGPPGLWGGALFLSGLGVFLGLFPSLIGKGLIQPGASAAFGEGVKVELGLWHGLNVPLMLSGITLLTGLLLYRKRASWRNITAWTGRLDCLGPEACYGYSLKGLVGLAGLQTRLIQHGYLRLYLFVVLAFAVVMPGYFLVFRGGIVLPEQLAAPDLLELVLGAGIAAAAWFTSLARTRLGAIVSLGAVGYGVAMVFILYGAPDLALTQGIMETLTVILFVLVFQRLRPYGPMSPRASRVRDLVLALAAGAFMTVIILAVSTIDLAPSISAWHTENSVSKGYGRNIVNVILVDFRAIDTMGEITVLVVAAVGVLAMLKLRPGREENPR